MTGGAGTSFAAPERDHVNMQQIYLTKLKFYTPGGLAPTLHDVATIRASVYGGEQDTIHAIFPDYIEALSIPGPPPGTSILPANNLPFSWGGKPRPNRRIVPAAYVYVSQLFKKLF